MKKGKDNHVIPLEGNCANMSPTEFEQYTLFFLDKLFKERGVEKYTIRHDVIKKGLDGKQYMRIAVRSHEDNAKFIQAFRELDQ